MADWRFLSNHGQALVCVARDPSIRLRDIAAKLDVTERTAHRIVDDLVRDGYLIRQRQGNRNHYEVRPEKPMQDSLLEEHWIGEFLTVLLPDGSMLSRWRQNGSGDRPDD